MGSPAVLAELREAGLLNNDESDIPEDDDEQAELPLISKLSRPNIDKLIIEHREHGRRLAWSFLTTWRVRMGQDDVMSVVGAALCEAANRFDPTKGVAFKTFFFYHLRGMLLKEIARVIQEQKVLQFVPSNSVTENIPIDKAAVSDWASPLVENNNPERIIERRQVASACWEACGQLDILEQEVLVRFFVFDEPLVTIAEELKYCRCHISRVKSRALAKLARILKESLKSQGQAVEEEIEEEPEEEEESVFTRMPRRGSRRDYTGGRGRRKEKKRHQKSEALQKILASAY